MYLTIQDGHIRELESLALRILKPVGNRVGGKFARAENLRTRLAREIRELERGRLREIMGTQPRSKPIKAVRKARKVAGTPVLAKYANRPARLRRRYKGKLLTARVRPDGSIRFAGEVFNSPSLAAHAAVDRKRPVNGWLFWTYERAPGDWVRLDQLRK